MVSLMIPDVSGKMTDVVLGHESIEEYLNTPEKFLGALIGRYGNRIKKMVRLFWMEHVIIFVPIIRTVYCMAV